MAEIEIWYFAWDDPPTTGMVEALYPSLSAGERDQYHRFHFDRDGHAYLLAHVLLRRVLSRCHPVSESAWTFSLGSHGKPFIALPECGLHFSLTHTAGLVACAASTYSEIGVDAERIDRCVEYLDLARSIFAPGEVRSLEREPAAVLPERFFTIWTLKEAYVKARGLGLSLPLQDFEVRPDLGDSAAVSFFRGLDADPCQWRFRRFRPTAPHVMAAAVRASVPLEFTWRNAAVLLDPSA